MIQRIQTIWLILASAAAFLSIRLPFYVGTNSNNVGSYELKATENLWMLLLTIAVGLVSLIAIFLYKDRRFQMRICVAGIFLQAALCILYYREANTFSTGTLALTALLQAGIPFFLFLAIRGIRNDNRIIRESERLR